MAEIPVRIKIAEREYPLRVEAKEEEHVRKAAKMINEKLTKHINTYPSADKQDVLAMCALEFAAELSRVSQRHEAESNEIRSGLSELSSILGID